MPPKVKLSGIPNMSKPVDHSSQMSDFSDNHDDNQNLNNSPMMHTENTNNLDEFKQKQQVHSELEAKIKELELELELKNQEINSAKTEIDDWKNKSARIFADLQNIKKQSELEVSQAKKSVKKTTISSVLTFLNTLNLAFTFAPESEDPKIIQFITTLKDSFERILQDLNKIGIEVIVPKIGEPFNAEYMQALNPQPNQEDITVKQIVTLGLKIDNTMVQPASVMI